MNTKLRLTITITTLLLINIVFVHAAYLKGTFHESDELFGENKRNLDYDQVPNELVVRKAGQPLQKVTGPFHAWSRHDFGNQNWDGVLMPVDDKSYRITLSHSAALQGNIACRRDYCQRHHPSKSPSIDLPYSPIWYKYHDPVW